MTYGSRFAGAVSPFPRRHGIEKKERKGLSFREAEMWDPWASSVLLVSKTAGDKKRQIASN
jgi:hypothetical protein